MYLATTMEVTPCGWCWSTDMVHWAGVGLVLAHRLRRRSGIDLALVRCSVFAE